MLSGPGEVEVGESFSGLRKSAPVGAATADGRTKADEEGGELGARPLSFKKEDDIDLQQLLVA